MTKKFWMSKPDQRPIECSIDNETHYLRRVTPYELGLLSAQCIEYCGYDVETMTDAPVVKQIKALAFTVAFALCDENGTSYVEPGLEEKPTDEFIEFVEQIVMKDVDLLIKISLEFIETNSPHIDPDMLERSKKNLNSTNSENGRSDKPHGPVLAEGSG